MLRDSDSDALERYRRATHNLLFADGRQWIDWNLRDRGWRDAPAPEGRVRIVMNYTMPILRARMQRMTSANMSWRTIASGNDHESRDRAIVATNTLDARWAGSDMDAKLRDALWLSFSCGVSYLKQFWNPNIGQMVAATVQLPHPVTQELTDYQVSQDGQPLADPETGDPIMESGEEFTYRPGDTDTAVRSIFNVRLNQDAFGLTSSEGFRWLIDSEVMPISVIKERYGEAAKDVQSISGVSILKQFEGLIRSVGRKQGGGNGSNQHMTTGKSGKTIPDKDTSVVSEFWEAPTETLPGGRLIIIAGDELISDEELPQGKVPFVPIYDEQRPFDAYGRATVDDLVHPQKVINKQWSLVLEEQSMAGIGQWAMFDVPGLSDQVSNLAGAHVKIPMQSAVAGRSIGDLIQRIPPTAVSPDRWRLIDKALAVMFDIGAFHEVQRGQVPPGVDSGIAIQLLQEAEAGQLADAVNTLKTSLIEWGRQTLGLARWGYGETEERWIPVERQDLGFLVESVSGSDLPAPDTVNVDLDAFKPQSQAAMNAEIKEMMGNGWIDPREGIRLMDLGRGVEGTFESQNRHYTRARGENLAIERGEVALIDAPPGTPLEGTPALIHPEDQSPYLLPMNDEHEIHIRLHEEILLDDSKPWPTRQAIALHIAEHQSMIRLLTVQAMEAEAAAQTTDV